MLGKAPTPIVVALILGFGVVFAMPLAGAVSFGVDAGSVDTVQRSGVTPAYGQTWVGEWMQKSGWSGYESDLRGMRDDGVTPVIMWYYWGDPISKSLVTYGGDSKSRSEWDAMAKELAVRAKNIMGSRTFYVVLEPEFNKNGIQDWETFDGYLQAQARAIKAAAPNAKIVVGFGHWGGWSLFDRAAAESEMVGFQVLRASTRDTTSQGTGVADQMISISKELKGRFGKDVMVFDLGVATYGGWEWVQEKALDNVLAKRTQLRDAGVRAIIWRYVHDNDHSSGYFGAAESSWGVVTKWGSKKAAYDELIELLKGGSSGTSTGSTSTSGSTSTTSSSSTFSSVSGNQWWMQAKVAGSPSKVEARVDGGSWKSMSKQSWGAYAVSMHMPSGSVVTLRATYSDGRTATASYDWPSATPTSASTSSSTSSSTSVSFSGVKLGSWWTQVSVSPKDDIASVKVRVNGGTWTSMTKYDWGWGRSVQVPYGAKVEFEARTDAGQTVRSTTYTR